MPTRVQLRRSAGWRMPAGVVKCDRSTRFGNHQHPVNPDLTGVQREAAQAEAARAFRRDLFAGRALVPQIGRMPPMVLTVEMIRRELRGKDLGCWCGLGQACHVDTLLEVANS